MDLLAPFKMCLQCLPVFSISHPTPPRLSPAVAAAPSHATSETSTHSCISVSATPNSTENDFQEGEKPSFSDASLSHDHQHQDLPLSEDVKELGLPVYTLADFAHSEHAKKLGSLVPAEAKTLAKEKRKDVHHDSSHDSNQEVFDSTVPSNDVKSSTPGSMPLPSPITPAPIGLGYIIGQHASSHHIHHQAHSRHNEGHSGQSFFHSHSHSHSHDKAPPSSHSTQDEQHIHPPSSSPGDGGEEHAHHQHSQKQINDANDDSHQTPPSESSQHAHGHYTHVDHSESFHSASDIELATAASGRYDNFDKDTDTNGSSSTLETSQSEPIEGVGAASARMRRRDQIKHQLKDIRNQLKQGGHHLKEEGSKHLQNMVSNMNKQAQEIEKSGSLFIVPRV